MVSSLASAQNTEARGKESFQDRLIEELIQMGDSFRALTLLKEEEFRYRGTAVGFLKGKRILGLYLQAKEYDFASTWLDKMMRSYPFLRKNYPDSLLKAELSYLYGNYLQTTQLMAPLPSAQREPVYTFASAAMDPEKAHVDLKECQTEPCHQLDQKLQDFQKNTSPKSPGLALALGVVPGMGQVYAGATWGGITSFLLNAVLISTTVYAATHGETAFAIVDGVVAAGFYSSSIYAGYEATRRYNEARILYGISQVRSIPIELNLLKLSF